MKISILFAGLVLAAGAGAADAQMSTTTTAKSTTATSTTKPLIGSTKATVVKNTAATTRADANGHMVATTTKTGKKITYDCSKPGNKTKTACKGK